MSAGSFGGWHGRARAAELELTPSRLSQGDCSATDAAGPLVLRDEAGATLRPDQAAWRQLVTQVGYAVAPTVLAPVTTSGPIGFDVGLETTITKLDAQASSLRRGTQGSAQASATCAGRNDSVRERVVGNRLHFEKGLPYGLTVGALVGRMHAAGTYVVGVDLKLALLEQVWRRTPDVALRAALNKLVGEPDVTLYVAALDAIVSQRFIVRRSVELSPWLGAGVSWTRASTGRVDLTPNIDALACGAGSDAVCNAGGLGASDADLAHDVRFVRVSQLRLRAFAGLWLRYRQLALSSAVALDPQPPRAGDRGRGDKLARQWTLSISPTLTF
jgi:hypothetical protein